jgi:fatty acid desaturase (delta-4 desaturase)
MGIGIETDPDNNYNMYNIKQHEVIIDGSVYDLNAFARVHPGGSNALNIFGGSDATVHYFMLHPHLKVRTNALEPYKLRKAHICDNKYILNSCAFQELKKRVRNVVAYPYATREWYLKACIILGTEIYLEYHNMMYGFTFLKSVFLGFMMALIGLCIQHDANHGAVSPNGFVNWIWGLTQDWIGGSSLLWKHHHVLMHHAYTNMDMADPDATTDIIRLHTETRHRPWHRWQGIYTWILLPLLPLNWHFKEIWDLYTMRHMGRRISLIACNEAHLGIILRFLFLVRFYVVPLYLYPSCHTVACICTCLAVGGGYLGINFIISHNFEGVKHMNKNYGQKDWSVTQIETSSTVGGRLLGFFHGGLNYQIEHHLFPRICHVHYHKIKPIVQQWSYDHGVKYTYFNTITDNVISCYKYLVSMGK